MCNGRVNISHIFKTLIVVLCLSLANGKYNVERVTEPLKLGEGPHWNAETQLLYFVDILNNTIHLYDPITKQHNFTSVEGESVTFIIPVAGEHDKFLVSTGLDIRFVEWNGNNGTKVKSWIIYSAPQKVDGSRFNDAKVDRSGQLWAGTMGPEVQPNTILERTGKLYQISPKIGIRSHLSDILISNGMDWTIDGEMMYYTDTGDNTVDSFRYNASAEEPLSERKRIFNFTLNNVAGKTDGLTIDREGNLWLACYGGYQVLNVDPKTGKILMKIPIEANQVTSLTWGGAQLDELYVTTAKKGLADQELVNYPFSGSTYRITGLGTSGYPGNNYVIVSDSKAIGVNYQVLGLSIVSGLLCYKH